MKGYWKASRIFASELLKDDENEKLSNDNTQQLAAQISKQVTQNVLKDFHEDYMNSVGLQFFDKSQLGQPIEVMSRPPGKCAE